MYENGLAVGVDVERARDLSTRQGTGKPLRPNPIAPWELRVGELRVFYEVVGSARGVLRVLVVGRKRRNVLTIGGKEIRL